MGEAFAVRFKAALARRTPNRYSLRWKRERKSSMRLLVVEDEQTLARHLRKGLQEASWTVDTVDHVAAAWRMLLLNPYDLIVLDLGLPDQDGTQLLRKLRGAGMTMPVLVLTARAAVEDRIAGLDAGADDYMGKPFVFGELLARVNALHRRSGERTLVVLRVGDLELDVRRRQAQRDGRRIDLTAREFNLLELLMRHSGEVVTRSMLADQVWGERYDSLSNLIEVFINRLRRKIENADGPRLLHTVRGAGYVLRED
jgi:two-component system copper resistance phosphate regulon response regulator CusR